MMSRVKIRRSKTLWHHWFAWRPVKVHAGTMYVWVWWRTVERKITYSYEDYTTHYRLLRNP